MGRGTERKVNNRHYEKLLLAKEKKNILHCIVENALRAFMNKTQEDKQKLKENKKNDSFTREEFKLPLQQLVDYCLRRVRGYNVNSSLNNAVCRSTASEGL